VDPEEFEKLLTAVLEVAARAYWLRRSGLMRERMRRSGGGAAVGGLRAGCL